MLNVGLTFVSFFDLSKYFLFISIESTNAFRSFSIVSKQLDRLHFQTPFDLSTAVVATIKQLPLSSYSYGRTDRTRSIRARSDDVACPFCHNAGLHLVLHVTKGIPLSRGPLSYMPYIHKV